MGIGKKLGDLLGIPDGDDIDELDDEIVEETPVQPVKSAKRGIDTNYSSAPKMDFILVKPEKYDECVTIGSYLLERKTVVLNLEGTGKDVSRRIVDFLGGVAFALRGQIKKVSIATYIIIPHNASISGDSFDDIEASSSIFY